MQPWIQPEKLHMGFYGCELIEILYLQSAHTYTFINLSTKQNLPSAENKHINYPTPLPTSKKMYYPAT